MRNLRDGSEERRMARAADDREESGEYRFSDRDFHYIRGLVGDKTGIVLPDVKRTMVYARLVRRLRALKLDSFAQYCRLLDEAPGEEIGELINAITTNLTAFFREPHHFDYLRNTVVPELMARNADTRRLRIWSAGCSTGEEPYSIAMVLADCLGMDGDWDWRILATDLDTAVLAKAERGIYSDERVAGMDRAVLKRWFLRGGGSSAGAVKVRPELRAKIRFRQLNLMEPLPLRGPLDVVFCRNVVIYFSKDTQRMIFRKFAACMAPGSHLFIGHSETLFRISDAFESLGQTMYRRRA